MNETNDEAAAAQIGPNSANSVSNSNTAISGDSHPNIEIRCKPKPIKPASQMESVMYNYQIPISTYHGPKNPSGVSTFHPTGKNHFFLSLNWITT